jgi:glycosyltransferase involved in cell wall biosynthesis
MKARKRDMRILFVLDYFHPHIGGVENLFKSLAQALVQRGHLVSVITLWLPGTQQFEVIEGVEILRVRTPFSSRFLFAIWALRSALNKAREADYIHTTLYSAAFPAFVGAHLQQEEGCADGPRGVRRSVGSDARNESGDRLPIPALRIGDSPSSVCPLHL